MKRLFMLLCAVVAFAACEQVFIDVANDVAESDRSLSVSFEGDDTRVQLNEAQKTVWTEGDLLSVFYRSTVNEKWQFMGKTGDRTGDIVPVDNSVNPPATHNHVVVVYPYNEDYFYNTETYNIEASIPAVQHYLKDSYGTNGTLMVSSSEFNKVSLKSVCGWLKLQLTGEGEVVKSITLRGNDGEQVAGLIYVDSANATAKFASTKGEAGDEVGGTLVRPGAILTEVTLDCGDGVTLGEEATAFYIALPPQTFEKGFEVEITSADDTKMVKSSSDTLTIERNHIQPMAAIKFTPTVPNNQIWYTSTDGKIVTPYSSGVFGANVVYNTCENGRGIIEFDAPITSIGEKAFYDCDNLKSITLPNSVTLIAKGALACCDNLTSLYGKFASADNRCFVINGVLEHFIPAGLTIYTIPDGVTEIGDYAFSDCSCLTSVTIPDCVTSFGYRAFYNCSSLTSVLIPDGVTEIGEEAFQGCSSLTSVHITDLSAWCKIDFGGYYANPLFYAKKLYLNNSEVTNLTIPSDITEIKKYAFRNCNSLTSVTIGNSVTSIGERAFQYCSNLTSVTIGNSVTSIVNDAFAGCTSLTSITIPDSVTEIGSAVFWKCTSLTSVTIPDSVTSIGKQAFDVCSSLTSVYCKPTTPPAGGQYMFDQSASGRKIYVPYNSVNAYKSADGWSRYASDIVGYNFETGDIFRQELLYTSTDGKIVTPYSLDAFGANIISNTYENGSGVIEFDALVTSIGESAFAYCYSLTSITIPDSVTTIGDGAFNSCSSLTSVIIPDGVTSIGERAFGGCSSLTAFYGKFASSDNRCLVLDGVLKSFAPAGLTSYTIPNSVTSIGSYTFNGCSSLKSVTIGDSVTSIGSYAFRYCDNMTSITIGNSVTSIGASAFYNCSSLKSVTIPNSVTKIGGSAFYNCRSLARVYCKPTTPPTASKNMFLYVENGSSPIHISCNIYVPTASLSAYRYASGWSEYYSSIKGYDF